MYYIRLSVLFGMPKNSAVYEYYYVNMVCESNYREDAKKEGSARVGEVRKYAASEREGRGAVDPPPTGRTGIGGCVIRSGGQCCKLKGHANTAVGTE
tara:strand:+ start:337 stop:627 length:291 start_codon:yes stop_codon:yes gene_type:complete